PRPRPRRAMVESAFHLRRPQQPRTRPAGAVLQGRATALTNRAAYDPPSPSIPGSPMRLPAPCLAALLSFSCACAAHAADWTTPAETSRFQTTPDYATTRAWLARLAQAAPDTLHLGRFGTSPEGRDLMLVVAA